MLPQGFLLLQATSDHGYGNPDSVPASRLKSTMRKISGTSPGTRTPILVDTTASATAEIGAALGNPKVVKGKLRREHGKHLPPNPEHFMI